MIVGNRISDIGSRPSRSLFVSMTIPNMIVVLVFAAGLLFQMAAQTVSTSDPSVTAADIIVSGAHAIAVGDGTTWVLTKHTLLKVNPTDNQLVSAPVEEMKVRYFVSPMRQIMQIGGGSVWIFASPSCLRHPPLGPCYRN
jgi:hypothetical protein